MDNKNSSRLEELEIELQKTEILIEQLDNKMTMENKDLYMDQYLQLKEKYNALLTEKKKLRPKEVSFWEKMPLWMVFYGLFLLIIVGLPYVSWMIWIYFAGVLPIQEEQLNKFLVILATFSLPLICLFISWVIYANLVNRPFVKKAFRYLWIGQAIITILNALFLYFYIPNSF